MLKVTKRHGPRKVGDSGDVRPSQATQLGVHDVHSSPSGDSGLAHSPQINFHPMAKDMIKEYIFSELPVNLLRLPKIEICNQWAILDHVQHLMEVLEYFHKVPSELQDSDEEPDPADIAAFVNDNIKWAIFSHHWGDAEPTYEEVKENRLSNKPGHEKLRAFCEVAHGHNAEFAWSDTCCINKKDSVEHSRSIRNMYRWYANAPICIAHLKDTTDTSDLWKDVWFTRGWTLLELLAPKKLKFYNRDWRPLTDLENDKESEEIAALVERATTITPHDLRHFSSVDMPREYGITKRMRWAAQQETTIGEDRAYSLMGIFGVSLYIDYGEGQERAFWRLMEQILHFSNSPEVLNWVGSPSNGIGVSSSAFPSRIRCFKDSHDLGPIYRHDEELALTPRGLKVDLLVLPAQLVPHYDGAVALQALGCNPVLPHFFGRSLFHDNEAEFAFGVWNFHTTSKGKCELAGGNVMEAVLLTRQVNPEHPNAQWVKVCTKRFIRLEDVQEHRWEDFKTTVYL